MQIQSVKTDSGSDTKKHLANMPQLKYAYRQHLEIRTSKRVRRQPVTVRYQHSFYILFISHRVSFGILSSHLINISGAYVLRHS